MKLTKQTLDTYYFRYAKQMLGLRCLDMKQFKSMAEASSTGADLKHRLDRFKASKNS